jgi:hypothetical protein
MFGLGMRIICNKNKDINNNWIYEWNWKGYIGQNISEE